MGGNSLMPQRTTLHCI